MNHQNIIETFFYMLGQFAFDRAKTYIESRKELLQKSPPTLTVSAFVSLLSTFAQLAEAEKFYHNQPSITHSHTSFLPSRNFLRKERNLKDVYEDIRLGLQRIEARPKQDRLQAELDKRFSYSSSFHSNEADLTNFTNLKSSYDASKSLIDNDDQSDKYNHISPVAANSSTVITSGGLMNLNDRPGFVSPKQSRSTADQNLTNQNKSPNKFSTLSPFSWFYSGFKQKTPTSSPSKTTTKANQPKAPSSVSRRLFCDHTNDTNTSNQTRMTPIEKSEFMHTSAHHGSTTITDCSNIKLTHDNTTQGPNQLLTTQLSSRQISLPVLSSPSANTASPPPNSVAITPVTPVVVAEFSEELMSHFCLQLQYYTQARLELIGIYEKLFDVTGEKHVHVDGIFLHLSMFYRKYQKYFHHPLLAPIKEGMTLECEVLMTLIKTAIDIQHWRFLSSVFDLQDAQQKLNYWATNTFNKENSKRRFNIKAQPIPRLYDWLCRLREFLVAKFTIYFHSTLCRNLPHNTIKNTCTKLSIDFYQKLSHFQRKIDALFIAMLFDVTNEKDYRGQGYHFPTRKLEQLGKITLQTMMVTPADAKAKLDNLLADIFMIVAGQSQTLNEGQFQFFGPSNQLVLFLTKPDPHVVLVVTVEGQKSDREALIKTFLNEITNQLSGNRMIMSLHTNVKSPQI